ncbi:MAG: ABC transporter ATP-binding protein [Candidatus Hecatellales archaeon]|nr:MAG: ABC transporter ATP-binding protein [Candidatus Hecatellales archaeon]
MRTILEVKDLHGGYGKLKILYGVSLRVREKEMVCVIGPNGAGKSTLFKTIVGILKPTSGKIIFDGEDVTGLSTDVLLRKGLAYIPQGRVIFPYMSVEENLEMGAYVRESKEEVMDSLEKVYSMFPVLREKRKKKAGTLSGGEQQLLEIGMALMLNPKILLFDEPSLGLSPKVVNEVFEKIEELRKTGVTIMLIEQNARKALEVSDYGYVLELGRNRFEGPAKELLHNDEVKRLYLGGG